MSKSYHPGIYQYSSKQFSCCQNIDRRSAGCQNTSAGLYEYLKLIIYDKALFF